MSEQKLFDLVPLTRDNIRAGLILRSPAKDGSVHIFNDTAIERIEDGVVYLVRPYCHYVDGKLEAGCERYSATIEQLIRTGCYHYVMEGTGPAQTF